MVSRQLPIDTSVLAELRERNGIDKLSLLGSGLRDDFGPESDIDLLVEFLPDHRVSLLDIVRMERDLSELVGRQVELVTPGDLSPFIRDRVLASAEVQYAAERSDPDQAPPLH